MGRRCGNKKNIKEVIASSLLKIVSLSLNKIKQFHFFRLSMHDFRKENTKPKTWNLVIWWWYITRAGISRWMLNFAFFLFYTEFSSKGLSFNAYTVFRASQFAKVFRNFAPQGSFASFFKVICRSGLLFPIQDRLTVPGKAGRFT